MPLLDSAPLLAAAELGYFREERLAVTLHRQVGWGNVRDKLVYGQVDVSHTVLGMAPVSVLGRERFAERVVALMSLGSGGNAITLSKRITDAGACSATTLASWVRQRRGSADSTPPVIGYVFGCSTHHYLLREWLVGGGIDPDRDVQLCVRPPPQMVGQLALGALDGFCCGEPWNTVADLTHVGRVVAATVDILPSHPEKMLAANHRWLARNAEAAVGLVRAVLRACAFCHDPANAGRVAEILSRPQYLDVPEASLLTSLSRRRGGTAGVPGPARALATAPNCDPAGTFASATQAAWLLRQMIRWGHLPRDTDVIGAARRSVETKFYRRAAESLGIDCPSDDFPPMRLRSGWFTAESELPPLVGPNFLDQNPRPGIVVDRSASAKTAR